MKVSMSEFQDLVDEYYQALYRFAYSMVKSEDRAADLVQQTYCIWAQKGHQLHDRTKAKTWLFTTLYREHLGQARRNNRFSETEIGEMEYQLPSEEQDPHRQLDAKRAVEILQQLDEIYRAPLSLFYLQQHSYKEIAEILDVPMGTVMSRISRGKELLRSQMLGSQESAGDKVIAINSQRKVNGHG